MHPIEAFTISLWLDRTFLLEIVSLWDPDVGCHSCLQPSLSICTADSFPTDEKEKWIVVTLSYHINTVLHQSFSYRLLSSNDTKIHVKKLMWLRNLSVEVVVSSIVTDLWNSFVLSSLKPPLWKSYPKGMNGCSLKFCSIWCGCKYWLFYGNEFVWLVYSYTVSLDLKVDVCILQNHCQELHEVLE